jgi:hypothetical protein
MREQVTSTDFAINQLRRGRLIDDSCVIHDFNEISTAWSSKERKYTCLNFQKAFINSAHVQNVGTISTVCARELSRIRSYNSLLRYGGNTGNEI